MSEYLSDKCSQYKKYKYRHPEIKETLKKETGYKCVYCESKIGHNTPGDIEHKIPSSKAEALHFNWENLTIACTECNRRKNDYYETDEQFLDPYNDEVEEMIEHHGPIVSWKTGYPRVEITVRILGLNAHKRSQLIFHKIIKIEELNNLLGRWHNEANSTLKRLLLMQVGEMTQKDAEYSAMVISILQNKGITT